MNLIVNGENRETEAETVRDFLATINLRSELVVVEHNGDILARNSYDDVTLKDGDVLEIVQMMAGG